LDHALECVEKTEERQRKKYRLAELISQLPEVSSLDDPEIRDWMDMRTVGREFGASAMEKFAQISPAFVSEGLGDQ